MFKKFTLITGKLIESIENSKAPFVYFVLSFLFAITLRNFFEFFSDHTWIHNKMLVHYYLFYVAMASTVILLFYIITKTEIVKIAKTVLTGFIIIASPPIFDLIISKGKGFDMAYMMPGVYDNLLLRYFTFFGNFPGQGVTPGIRIEIALVLIFSFIYFFIKTNKRTRSLLGALLLYTLLFFYGVLPFLLKKTFAHTVKTYDISDTLMINFYLSFLLFTGFILLYLANKQYFKILFKDLRFLRISHFLFMFLSGVIAGLMFNTQFELNIVNVFYFIFIPVSIIFACIFSLMSNNLEDIKIDEVSNKDRPLVKKKIDPVLYAKLSWFFLALSLVYAYAVNFATLFLMFMFIGNYFLYSARPLRLKRLPIISKFLIALNSLVLMIVGYLAIVQNTVHGIHDFPKPLLFYILFGFTLVINFIDIKDYEGDKKEGIKTLPVILGLKRSKIVIGLFFILTYLSFYFVNKEPALLPLLIFFGLLQFYFVNRKNYVEKYIFITYLLSLIIILFYLV